MRIAVIGATGNVGNRIIAESIDRGHKVTAIARNPALPTHENMATAAGDVTSPDDLSTTLVGHDVVISSVTFVTTNPALLIKAVRQSGVPRYLSVGGAGSLWASPNTLFVDSPDFPQEVLDESHAGRAMLDALQQVTDFDWTVLTPAAIFVPGARTGTFRLGSDHLLYSDTGQSWISYEDYAVALLDEIEQPQHPHSRFTVGY